MRHRSSGIFGQKDCFTQLVEYAKRRRILFFLLTFILVWGGIIVFYFKINQGASIESEYEPPQGSGGDGNNDATQKSIVELPPAPEEDPPQSLLGNDNVASFDDRSPEEIVAGAQKVLLTYGQNCCDKAKKRMCETAYAVGKVNQCFAYDQNVMDPEFREKNKDILKHGRGAGYWLWKPYIIYKHLTDDKLPEGSYIIYSDAGAKVVGNVAHVLNFMQKNDHLYKGVLFFGVGFSQKNFCKRDAFVLQDCDNEKCYDAMQINAFSGFFRKCDYSRMVVKAWLEACQDPRILTDISNTMGLPNLKGFRDHRHDQAVITNLMNSKGWYYDTSNGPVLDKVFYHDRFKG